MNLSDFKKETAAPAPRTRKTGNPLPPQRDNINISIDLNEKPRPTKTGIKSGNKFSWFKKHRFLSIFFIFILLSTTLAGTYLYRKIQDLKKTGIEDITISSLIKNSISAVSSANNDAIKKLKQTDARTNILLVGVDARSEDDSFLTDSIMLLSYDHATNQYAQISLTRDLQAKYNVGNQRYNEKINSVFPYTINAARSAGKSLDEGIKDGFKNLSQVSEGITGLPIHYGILINFNGFKQIIDNLGGLDIDVKNSFSDSQFPKDDDSGTITITFKEGMQQMDGSRALQYARSRHSQNPLEAGDGARARRQQIVINALKDKFVNSDIFKKFQSLSSITTILGNNIKFYNISNDEIGVLIESRELLKAVSSYALVLDNQLGSYPAHLLNDPPPTFVLSPQTASNYDDVKELIKLYLTNPYLLQEDSKLKLVRTNSKRYNDYLKAKNIVVDQKLKFNWNDGLVTVVATTTPSPTPTGQQEAPTSFGTLYKLEDGNDKSIEFYTKLFESNQMKLEVVSISKDTLPKGLSQQAEEMDILIVIN